MSKFLRKIIAYFSNRYYLKRQADADFNPVVFYSLKSDNAFLRAITSFLPLIARKRLSKLVVNSRIVEEPFVFQNLNLEKGAKTLDLGCCYSKVSLQLASLGYKTAGVDLNDYKYLHPNLQFVRGNFLEKQFPNNYFDCVVAISTVEHIGLDCYGGSLIEGGDQKTIKKIHKILKLGGIFIITVPFGRREIMKTQRVYDTQSLSNLLREFKIEKEEYYEYSHGFWKKVKKEELARIRFSEDNQGLALILGRKEHK